MQILVLRGPLGRRRRKRKERDMNEESGSGKIQKQPRNETQSSVPDVHSWIIAASLTLAR